MGTETVTEKEVETKVSDLEQKIIRQMEYYFGNFNLCKDKFLRELIKLDDGWVPLDTMVKFNRLKSLSTDFNAIGAALKKSPNNLLEVDADSTKVRRRVEVPVPDESQETKDGRTLYVKGFKKTHTLDQLLDFFKPHNAENIYMRRRHHMKDKPFKGSCLVMFEAKEDADKFLETKGLKYDNTELLKERKVDYTKRKDVYYDNLRAEKEKRLEKKSETDKDAAEEAAPEPEGKVEVSGCLIKVVGLDKDCTREGVKEAFDKFGTVVFTDYFRGNPEGVVRYDTGIAASVLEKVEEEDGVKILQIGASKATLSLVEGDAEKEYWKSIALNKLNARQRHMDFNKQSRGRFGKKNWGNKRQRGGHRRNDDRSDQPPSKRVKVEKNGEGQESTPKESSQPDVATSMDNTSKNGTTDQAKVEKVEVKTAS